MTLVCVYLSGFLTTYSNFSAMLLCDALCTPQSHFGNQCLGLSHEMMERFTNGAEMTDIHSQFLSLAQLMIVSVCICGCVEALGPSIPLFRGF